MENSSNWVYTVREYSTDYDHEKGRQSLTVKFNLKYKGDSQDIECPLCENKSFSAYILGGDLLLTCKKEDCQMTIYDVEYGKTFIRGWSTATIYRRFKASRNARFFRKFATPERLAKAKFMELKF